MSCPRFTFAEVLAATGANEAWLRTFIQRDKSGTLGTKDKRLRRLLFSGADVARISILHDLNAGLKVSPAGAWEIVKSAEALIEAKFGESEDLPNICAGVASDGELLCWHVNNDGVIETFNDAADKRQFETLQASRRPHIVVPIARAFEAIALALQAAENGGSDG